MALPRFLYYMEKSSSDNYSFEPQGQLDVGRLIRNEAPFKSSNPAMEEKKKVLVLNDWTIDHWSDEKRKKVAKLLNKLHDDGFVIHFSYNGLSEPLDDAIFKQLNFFFSMVASLEKSKPMPCDEIIKSSNMEYGYIKDQIQILDDYWLDVVLNSEQSLKPRHLDVDQLIKKIKGISKPTDVVDVLDEFLNSAIPKLEIIVASEIFSEASNSLLQRYKKKFPKASIVEREVVRYMIF